MLGQSSVSQPLQAQIDPAPCGLVVGAGEEKPGWVELSKGVVWFTDSGDTRDANIFTFESRDGKATMNEWRVK